MTVLHGRHAEEDDDRRRSGGRVVRVLSAPAAHPYVRHLRPPEGSRVVPVAVDPHAEEPYGRWSLEDHLGEADVVHLHSGLGDGVTTDDHDRHGLNEVPPPQLRRVVERLRAAGTPLVHTVHDPGGHQHRHPGPLDEILDLLVPAADALVALTPGAAAEVQRRWGRRSLVLPHPHVVPLDRWRRRRRRGEPPVVGVHVGGAAPGTDAGGVVRTLVGALPSLPPLSLRVDVDAEMFRPGTSPASAEVAAAVVGLAPRPGLDVRVGPRLYEAGLWDHLASLDVCVLPPWSTTDPAWLEACHDLGTAVVAPDGGQLAEQHPVRTYHVAGAGRLDEPSLVAAVVAALEPPVRPTWRDRLEERERVARAHEALYDSLLE